MPGAFDRHCQTTHDARPGTERHGNALTDDAREIHHHYREGFGLSEAQRDARERCERRTHHEQARKLDASGSHTRAIQGARRINEGAPGGVAASRSRLGLGLGAGGEAQRGAERALTGRTQLDYSAPHHATVRQERIELSDAER